MKIESNDKLKEIDIKNRACYYFDDIIRSWDRDIDFKDKTKNYTRKNKKIFQFMTFHTKFQRVQNQCVLVSVK